MALSITVTDPDDASFLTVWPTSPDPAARPTASSLNWTAGETAANAAQVKVGAGGKVSIYNERGNAPVTIDVVGWYADDTATSPGGRYTPVKPKRVLDSRGVDTDGDGVVEPLGAPTVAPLAPSPTCASPTQVKVSGGDTKVPATGVSAVVVNLTVTPSGTATAGSGALVAWASGGPVPTGSNVPYDLSRPDRSTIPTLAVTKVSADGKIDVCNRAPAGTLAMHAVADVVGW